MKDYKARVKAYYAPKVVSVEGTSESQQHEESAGNNQSPILNTLNTGNDYDWFAEMLKEARLTNKLLAEFINSSHMNKKGWFR